MIKYLRPVYIYTLTFTLLFCWWFLAFRQSLASQPEMIVTDVTEPKNLVIQEKVPLSSLDRATLHQALCGDIDLMTRFISDWDLDAELLEQSGYTHINRLPRADFLRSQQISRILQTYTEEQLTEARERYRAPFIIDDSGAPIDLSNPYQAVIPQTFLSAGIAMALLEPEHILALPEGIREQESLYPKQQTETVPHTINRFSLEALYSSTPKIAFIAPYSQPGLIQQLNDQGVQLHVLHGTQTTDAIKNAVKQIGHSVNRPLKAELMNLFIDAALLHLDNLRLVHLTVQPDFLILEYYHQFRIPGTRSLTSHLIQRMNYQLPDIGMNSYEGQWDVPVTEEQIHQYNPKLLLISTTYSKQVIDRILARSEALLEVDALKNRRVVIIDDATQKTSSQLFVLAYYDLTMALLR
ncbi:MAG: hypothetical protein H7A37_08935 [Chlamydiales bacterium]|nr:hypothetical protein [Chlamydiia bacterium]MCP5508404.1 hypothetical protein [Chlamydiales bacterium]